MPLPGARDSWNHLVVDAGAQGVDRLVGEAVAGPPSSRMRLPVQARVRRERPATGGRRSLMRKPRFRASPPPVAPPQGSTRMWWTSATDVLIKHPRREEPIQTMFLKYLHHDVTSWTPRTRKGNDSAADQTA
jgi:hypothetical protein